MLNRTIVPDREITGFPLVAIDAGRLAGEMQQILEQPLRLLGIESGNAVGVSTDVERRAPCHGMPLHQGPQRRSLLVEAVPRTRLGQVTDLGLGAVVRVIG